VDHTCAVQAPSEGTVGIELFENQLPKKVFLLALAPPFSKCRGLRQGLEVRRGIPGDALETPPNSAAESSELGRISAEPAPSTRTCCKWPAILREHWRRSETGERPSRFSANTGPGIPRTVLRPTSRERSGRTPASEPLFGGGLCQRRIDFRSLRPCWELGRRLAGGETRSSPPANS